MQSRCQWLGSPYYLRAQCALLHLLHSVSFFGFGFARYTSMSYRCFRYLKMKNVDELTGGEIVSLYSFYLGCFFKHFHLFYPISFVHSRIFDVVHTGGRNIVTLKRTVDTTWIPEQQAFILTRESSLSSSKITEAISNLEAISSIFLQQSF